MPLRRRAVMAGVMLITIFAPSPDLWMPVGAQQPPPPDVAPPPNVIITPDRLDGYQQPVMAEDPVRPGHLAIADQDAHLLATCSLAHSDDGGARWSNRRLAGRSSQLTLPAGAFCWNPTLAFGSDGTLYYALQTGFYFNQGDRRVLLTVSRDGGATFSPPLPTNPVHALSLGSVLTAA